MTAAALATRGLPTRPLFSAALSERDCTPALPRSRRLGWRLLGIGTALLLAGSSMVIALRDPAAIFGWQGVLWLASMGLLLAACARWYPPGAGADDPPWTRQEMYSSPGSSAWPWSRA